MRSGRPEPRSSNTELNALRVVEEAGELKTNRVGASSHGRVASKGGRIDCYTMERAVPVSEVAAENTVIRRAVESVRSFVPS